MLHSRWLLRYLFTLSAVGSLTYILFGRKPSEYHLCPNHANGPEKPLVFVGGHPRSGTTLLRVLLDVHPKIRCGPETHILPRILSVYGSIHSGDVLDRLIAAKLYPVAVNRAFYSFITTLIENAGDPAEVLCNKDPLVLQCSTWLQTLFPHARFIHLVRDGRAVTASMLKRNIKIGKGKLDAYQTFARWERIVRNISSQCVNNAACLTINYEKLVLQPRKTMSRVLEFLHLPWDDSVLNHHNLLKNRTLLSEMEPSTSQVIYPIHMEALYSWAFNNSVLSQDFIQNIHKRSEMLKSLGYAQRNIPPNYGAPEALILEREKYMHNDEKFRKIFGS